MKSYLDLYKLCSSYHGLRLLSNIWQKYCTSFVVFLICIKVILIVVKGTSFDFAVYCLLCCVCDSLLNL